MMTDLADGLLASLERGNPATCLYQRHAAEAAWSIGNQVRSLVHEGVYFAGLLAGVNELRTGGGATPSPVRGTEHRARLPQGATPVDGLPGWCCAGSCG
jgi:hypothetical protein